MLLSTPDGRQALQQARLQATTGHAEEAVASYNKLFNGAPPEGDIAVEYWSTVAKIPARRGEAINQLKRINADAPGNTGLQNNLALLLFSSDRRDEGFAVLEQMAKSNAGREGASKIWYGQIKDMPVSDASVSALKNIFRSLAMAIAWRLHNRNWQNSKNSWPTLLSALVRKV